jgi:hypothetical protein
MSPGRRSSFVVRLAQDGHGRIRGVVERVATGAKEAFTGMDAIGQVIARMLQREPTRSSAGPTASRPRAGSGTARRGGGPRAAGA